MYTTFQSLPITSIAPEGWLRLFLENQRDGLTGHLDTTGWPFDSGGWEGNEPGKGPHASDDFLWAAYEHTGYWFDGMVRCGHLLNDDFLIQKAGRAIEHVITNPSENGYLGPENMDELWPRAVFFRALMAEYSASGDKRILEALRRHYLEGTTVDQYVGGLRNICNLEEICWLYGNTGDERLLEYAQEAYSRHTQVKVPDSPETLLSDAKSDRHGVIYSEIMKLPTILYMYTGERRLLEATINGYRKVDRDHMLVDGVPSCNEGYAGKGPRVSHETCVVSDYPWGVGYVLLATGEAEWADKIERACFNAGIGVVSKDFKAYQYFSGPNQVILTRNSSHNDYSKSRMSFRPSQECECCAGNINRFMPNYVSRMWLSDGDGGLVAALYGPSSVRANVGRDGQPVTVTQHTDYPFSETIEFEVRTNGSAQFPLWLRIPGWCSQASVSVNGRQMELSAEPGTFVKLEREFKDLDRVTLSLPMSLKLSRWPRNGVAIERGPLAYSLRIEEDWHINEDATKSTEELPSWDILPSSPWNYALATNERDLEKDVRVVHGAMKPNPWDIRDGTLPIHLEAPARRVRGWTFHGVYDHPRDDAVPRPYKEYALQSPEIPDQKECADRLDDRLETVSLVPYGSTHLRLTVFPDGG